MAATVSPPCTQVAEPLIVESIAAAVSDCLTMCEIEARCVGVASVPQHDPGSITGIIGVHGEVSGFINVNLPQAVARIAVGGLLQDKFTALTPQVIDGVGEITNIVAGGIKRGLAGSRWAFSHFTVPSVIVGQNYQIAYTRGLVYTCLTFEHDHPESILLDDRLFRVAVSLIRL